MTKENGLGMTISVDDAGGNARAIGNDFTQLNFSTPRGVQDVTGLNKSAMERLLNLADFQISGTVVFNDGSNLCFDVFKTVASTSVARTTTLAHSGQTLANEVLYSDCPWTRAPDGALTGAPTGALADGTVPTWS